MGRAWASVAALGAAWSSLAVALAAGGHAPSATKGLLFPADSYYLNLALYVAPLCVGLWQVFARAVNRIVGGPVRATLAALGPVWALSILILFIIPDWIAYLGFGFEAMGAVVRYTAPLTLLSILFFGTRAVVRVHGAVGGRAFLAVVFGLVVHAIPAALLLR